MHPDFLVIGAQKAGTTWLDRNLRTHPQIWLPPEKEIHYFDLPHPLPFAALLLAPVRAARHWTMARLKRDYAKVQAGEQSMGWYLKYYFAPRTRRWYGSLFKPGLGQICGESTPRYAVLPGANILPIHRLMPDLKILYVLRDPIDRMWSDAAMFQTRRFGGSHGRDEAARKIAAFLRDPENLRHSKYAENLTRWESAFDPARICLLFQEDLAQIPQRALDQTTDFLGLPRRRVTRIARRRINSKSYDPIDEGTEAFLAGQLIEDLRLLNLRSPNQHTEAWLQRAEKALGKSGPSRTASYAV
jgi:hypothetical protein